MSSFNSTRAHLSNTSVNGMARAFFHINPNLDACHGNFNQLRFSWLIAECIYSIDVLSTYSEKHLKLKPKSYLVEQRDF